MKWAHLPNSGGLYDQHPKFMDDMFLVMNIEGEHIRAEQAKQNNQRNRPGMASSGRSRGRRR